AKFLVSAVRAKMGAPPPLPTRTAFIGYKPERIIPALESHPAATSLGRIPFRPTRLFIAGGVIAIIAVTTYAMTAWLTTEGAYKYGETFQDCRTCPSMVVVAGAAFSMGSTETNPSKSELPAHKVMIKGALAIGRFEITNQDYAAFLSAMLRNG